MHDGIDKLFDEVLKRLAYKLMNKANENLDTRGINDTGNLRGSSEVRQEGENYIIEWKAPYSGAVEWGSSPHYPPAEAIHGWVRRKLRITDEKKAWSAAYAIQKEIGLHGTTGTHFVRDAIDMIQTDSSIV